MVTLGVFRFFVRIDCYTSAIKYYKAIIKNLRVYYLLLYIIRPT